MGENVKHFSLEEKNDNTYGWPWNEVVKNFFKAITTTKKNSAQ